MMCPDSTLRSVMAQIGYPNVSPGVPITLGGATWLAFGDHTYTGSDGYGSIPVKVSSAAFRSALDRRETFCNWDARWDEHKILYYSGCPSHSDEAWYMTHAWIIAKLRVRRWSMEYSNCGNARKGTVVTHEAYAVRRVELGLLQCNAYSDWPDPGVPDPGLPSQPGTGGEEPETIPSVTSFRLIRAVDSASYAAGPGVINPADFRADAVILVPPGTPLNARYVNTWTTHHSAGGGKYRYEATYNKYGVAQLAYEFYRAQPGAIVL